MENSTTPIPVFKNSDVTNGRPLAIRSTQKWFVHHFVADIKKHAQELYAIINYGEMRKKLVFVNAKACMKLKELVYHGSVSIRVKGKNIRIKTPSCKALRQLNQMEGIRRKCKNFFQFYSYWRHCAYFIEWQEEIKLPSKIDVYLKPANVDSWGKVQNLAQNPRVKTILPLQKRVLSLLKTFEIRWRSRDVRLVCVSLAFDSPEPCNSQTPLLYSSANTPWR